MGFRNGANPRVGGRGGGESATMPRPDHEVIPIKYAVYM